MISAEDIQKMYKEHVSVNYTEEYRNKYVPLPFVLNNKRWKWERKAFARIVPLLEFREYMIEWNKIFDSVMVFNGLEDPELEYIKYKKLYNYNYEINGKYDLHCLELDKKDFDLALLNFTIEHLYNPILALGNIYRHIKVGGLIYVSGPVNCIPHCTPYHFYTGFTPIGLGVMIKLAGFNILKIGQWGNKEYYQQEYQHVWADYTYSDTPGLNDLDCPISTWCLAIKN